MKATAETIWRVPAYLPYLQPPLTDDVVASAENEIGYKLPCEYLNLLRKQNGGYIRFSLPEMVHDTISGIGPYFPSLPRFDWDECQEHVSYPLQGLVPFDGDGHWALCLDYRKNSQIPTITYADVECDWESHVADSFTDYLGMLRIRVGDELVLEKIRNIDDVKRQLSSVLGVEFEKPDTWAYGYPTQRAFLGRIDDIPLSLWISPNTVPRGFVRNNDRRYSQLKDLMPGLADRFPNLPEGSYILSVSDGARERVLNACSKCGLSAIPLRDFLAGGER